MSTKYVSTKAVAERFDIVPATVMAMVHSGQIPPGTYIRAGKVYRFDLEKVEAHLLETSGPPAGDDQLAFDFDNDNI